jgi:hypothetical protein
MASFYPGDIALSILSGYKLLMTQQRRSAIAAYKERKSVAGIYALRCAATGEAWVGAALDIDKVNNRLSFSLRGGGHPRRELQAAWGRLGEAAFAFEILERLEAAPSAYARDAALKNRTEYWRAALGAAAV